MALPKKGIRKITVDGIKYYFSVQLEYYGITIQVVIGKIDDPNKRFYLSVPQGDPYLEKGNNGIGVITPKLISKAIKFVNINTDWESTDKIIAVNFSNNEITLKTI